jgi:hypothetical protein
MGNKFTKCIDWVVNDYTPAYRDLTIAFDKAEINHPSRWIVFCNSEISPEVNLKDDRILVSVSHYCYLLPRILITKSGSDYKVECIQYENRERR